MDGDGVYEAIADAAHASCSVSGVIAGYIGGFEYLNYLKSIKNG